MATSPIHCTEKNLVKGRSTVFGPKPPTQAAVKRVLFHSFSFDFAHLKKACHSAAFLKFIRLACSDLAAKRALRVL